MSTTPFSSEFVTKLKGATSWRFSGTLGPVFTPRFFCCDDPNAMGISEGKEPVAVLSLSPNPCFVGDTVAFDGTDSYDPDGSITAYAFTFPSGSPASSTSSSGSVSWAAAGDYEVTLIVTDGTGLKSSPAREIMQVRDAAGEYYIATENGVYFTADGGQNWTAKNTGLSGAALNVNDIKLDPATRTLPAASRTLWIATDDGTYVSIDGGDSWTENKPASVSNTWGDATAPTVDDLEFMSLQFWYERLYAIANWTNAGGDERSWIFYTDNHAAVRDPRGSVTWSEV